MVTKGGKPEETEILLSFLNGEEIGKPADFVSVWSTENAFVLDFVSLRREPKVEQTESGPKLKVEGTVSSRVRIPPEQVFPLIDALQRQSKDWLKRTGRSEIPENWLKNETLIENDQSESGEK